MNIELIVGVFASLVGSLGILLWNGIQSRMTTIEARCTILEGENKALLTSTAVASSRFEMIMEQLKQIMDKLL